MACLSPALPIDSEVTLHTSSPVIVKRCTPFFDACLEREDGLDISDLTEALLEYFSFPSSIPSAEDNHVKSLLSKFTCTDEFLRQYGFKNDDIPYTRNLVANSNEFDLILLCWNPAKKSAIHAHASSNCWLKVIRGDMVENFYAPPVDNGPLTKIHKVVIPVNTVAYINDGIGLHAMGSASSTEMAYSLHLYSPPYQAVKCYDENGAVEDRGLFFYSKYGERV